MQEEHTIKEIRRIRKQISEKYSNSPRLLINHYLDFQQKILSQQGKNKENKATLSFAESLA